MLYHHTVVIKKYNENLTNWLKEYENSRKPVNSWEFIIENKTEKGFTLSYNQWLGFTVPSTINFISYIDCFTFDCASTTVM
jgi:hypothetical protein